MSEYSYRLRYHVLLVLLLTIVMPGTLSAASLDNARKTRLSIYVVKGFKLDYKQKVSAVKTGGTVYVDLESVSRAMRLLNKRNGSLLRMAYEEGGKTSVCRLRAGNNFVSFMHEKSDTGKRVVQLRSAPVLRKGRLWLPAGDAARLFSLWMDREVVYDRSKRKIEAFLWSSRPGSGRRTIGLVDERKSYKSDRAVPTQKSGTVITGLDLKELANGVIIRVNATGKKTPISFIKPDKQGTASLTLQNAKGNPADISRTFGKGLVKQVRAISLGNGAMQISIALNTRYYRVKSSECKWDSKRNCYVVSIMSDVDVQKVYRREKQRRITQALAKDLQKWKFDTIVLDAGHGGKDPGAIGPSGTREKDIVLKIVRDLGSIIRREWPNVKVVYTRVDDRFIPLKQRGKIANRNKGKLFVSVHCNAAKNRSARGAEVYILGPHKNDAALRVAMLENAAIKQEENYKEKYKGFSDEHTIMSSLAQNAFTLQSKEAARHVLEGMEKKTKINGRGVRQAGFMVLWTPSMPSLLVEAGYLSNREEEKMLRRRQVQIRIAQGIFNGLKQYRASYEKQRIVSGSRVRSEG